MFLVAVGRARHFPSVKALADALSSISRISRSLLSSSVVSKVFSEMLCSTVLGLADCRRSEFEWAMMLEMIWWTFSISTLSFNSLACSAFCSILSRFPYSLATFSSPTGRIDSQH